MDSERTLELATEESPFIAGGSAGVDRLYAVSFHLDRRYDLAKGPNFRRMLAVMTFNTGVLCAVIGGIIVGELVLGQYAQSGWQDGACHDG